VPTTGISFELSPYQRWHSFIALNIYNLYFDVVLKKYEVFVWLQGL
jgi:hypothetical protein